MPKKISDEPRKPEQEAYTLSDLEQIKVLADPLRIRILEAFSQERTTKQVAELLGEKPTKLYHHVDALERVGLIRLSRTRQNRGTVEKYYLAVARTFRANSRAFHAEGKAGSEETAAFRQMISTFFDTTSAELTALAERVAEDGMKSTEGEEIEKEAIVSFLEIRGSKKEVEEVRDKLHELIASLTKIADDAATDDSERYRFTLAYYPLDKARRTNKK
jgi:DNA-binding transcriptional ArsR family regulator